MTCEYFDRDFVHGYVAGTVPDDDIERFETHLLTCRTCQQQVRLGAVARVGLTHHRGSPAPARRWRRSGAAALLIAATLWIALLARRDHAFADLGTLHPPEFIGASVRGTVDSTTWLVDRGMDAYARGDYRTTVRDLTTAAARDSSAAPSFYLGVALVMQGRPDRAIGVLQRAKRPAHNPYENDARLVIAKAWLLLGRADSALVELQSITPLDPVARAHAAALADSIRNARR